MRKRRAMNSSFTFNKHKRRNPMPSEALDFSVNEFPEGTVTGSWGNALYFFTSRSSGNMKGEGGRRRAQELLGKVGIKKFLVSPEVEHGNKIRVVDWTSLDKTPAVDGLITSNPHILALGITGADCPGLFLNYRDRVLAAIHCGWRPVSLGIVGEAVNFMAENIVNFDPAYLQALIGPGICQPCFEFSLSDLPDSFRGFEVPSKEGKCLVDLKGIIINQLGKLSLNEKNITDLGVCTSCQSEIFFSARKDKFNPVQAGMGIICIPD